MSELCHAVHELLAQLPSLRFPFAEAQVPRDGIYLLFEEGETGHSTQRIVRVGTHTGAHQLRSRLQQHFLQRNKDRSIFRKNVGRALLNRDDDPFLQQWEIDLTSRKSKDEQGATVDREILQAVEERVSETILARFRFAVIQVPSRQERLYLEARLVSTVSLCVECGPSDGWLGLHSPKQKIRESGLWQVNELYKDPLSPDDRQRLRVLLTG